jgi:hypothetical protein
MEVLFGGKGQEFNQQHPEQTMPAAQREPPAAGFIDPDQGLS